MNKTPKSHPWNGRWQLENMHPALPPRSMCDLEYRMEQPDRAYWDWETADELPELPVQGYRIPHPSDHRRFVWERD